MQKFILCITDITNFTAGVMTGLLMILRRTFPRGLVPLCSVTCGTFQRRRRALRGAETFGTVLSSATPDNHNRSRVDCSISQRVSSKLWSPLLLLPLIVNRRGTEQRRTEPCGIVRRRIVTKPNVQTASVWLAAVLDRSAGQQNNGLFILSHLHTPSASLRGYTAV